MTIHVGMHQY